jgi:hypothetical protein
MGSAHVLYCIVASCVAADAAPEEPAAGKVDFYLTRMLAERQKVRSGEFVVSGTKSSKFPATPELDNSARVMIFCAFDESRIRWDNLESGIFTESPLTSRPKRRPGMLERKFVRTPQTSVTWSQGMGSNQIVLSPPNARSEPMLFFDVHGLGLMKWEDLNRSDGRKVDTTVAGLKKRPRDRSVDLSDPRYVQLVFSTELQGWSHELRYWLRPDQGFAPVRLEASTRNLDSPEESPRVSERAETSWEQIDDVWLPVKLEITRPQMFSDDRLAWKIRWRSVNKPIDDARFGWKDFGTPETVPVIDVTNGRAVVIRPGPEK